MNFIYKPFPGKLLNSIHVILEYKITLMVIALTKTVMEPFVGKQVNPFMLSWNVISINGNNSLTKTVINPTCIQEPLRGKVIKSIHFILESKSH